MKRSFIILLLISLFLAGCEKTVTFHLDDVSSKLVVEATIENGQPPYVILTKSLAYFSTLDPAVLTGSFVHGASVYVSNGIRTHQLKEYSIPVSPGYDFYYYSLDPASPATSFLGQLNTQYTLRIVNDGKEYTAATRIPAITKVVDSLYWKPAPPNNPVEKVMVMVKATDPPGYGDYIRYFTKRNSEPFYPGLISVYDDLVIDGTTYDVQLERGVNRNDSIPDGHSFFNKGDTVTFKLCNIDKPTFDFWRTMEYTYSSVGNPFSSPTHVISNLSPGALGYFGGYAAQYHTIILPP